MAAINMQKICRICMNSGDSLTSLYTVDDDFVELNVKLYSCVPSIQIDDPNLPSALCEECLEGLRQAYNFRQLCIKTTLKLFRSTDDPEQPTEYKALKIVKCTGGVDPDEEMDVSIQSNDRVECLINDAFAKINGNSDETKSIVSINSSIDDNISTTAADNDLLTAYSESDVNYSKESPTHEREEPFRIDSVVSVVDEDLDQPYICTKCDKGFNSTHALSEHLQSHLLSDLRLKCELCRKTYASLEGLTKHECKEWLQCSFCFRTFKSSAALFSHKYHKHIKPYICQICDKKFPNSKLLHKHMRLFCNAKATGDDEK